MMNNLKEIITALRDNPSATILAICMGAMGYLYSDFRDYITTQNNQQAVLNERFIQALEKINERLHVIETKINEHDKIK